MPRASNLSKDQGGTASLLGFLVATSVFAVTFATVVQVSVDHDDPTAAGQESELSSVATSVSDLLLLSPGRGWYGASDACVNGLPNTDAFAPDSVTRLGLGADVCGNAGRAPNNLSFEKVQNLHVAAFDADPDNGYVDYEEARGSLNLDAVDAQFHVRSSPLLPTVARALEEGFKDPNLRPLYVGDYDELVDDEEQTYLVQHQAGFADGADAVSLYVNLTNNGTVATAFSVTFKVQGQREVVAELHSRMLGPGASDEVTFTLHQTADWQWNGRGPLYDYSIRDPSKSVGAGTVSLAAISMTHALVRHVLPIESGQLSYAGSGATTVDLVYDALDGRGSSNVNHDAWSIEVRNSTGSVVAVDAALKTKGGTSRISVAGPGEYTAELKGGPGWTAGEDRFHVAATGLGRFTPAAATGVWVPDAAVAKEAAFLDAVIDQFDVGVSDLVYASADVPFLSAGDVLPDDNRLLAERFPLDLTDASGVGRLDLYNVVVVGSNVDHASLTSGNVKNPLAAWIQAGGTLIVFGSGEQAVQWLQPLFHVALKSASGGVALPDQNNPVLTTPNDLDVSAYDNHGTGWQFNSEDDRSHFTHVVTQGDSDILATSNPGAFGQGRILLSSWQPHDLTTTDAGPECAPGTLTADCPALQLMDNFVHLAYAGLYLDYGPPVPAWNVQGSETRVATLYHPQMDRQVELRITVYVFR